MLEKIFSNRLKIARKEAGYTQDSITKHLNITMSGYQAYEQGRNLPSVTVLVELAKILHVSTDYLLGLDDSIEKEAKNDNDDKIKED